MSSAFSSLSSLPAADAARTSCMIGYSISSALGGSMATPLSTLAAARDRLRGIDRGLDIDVAAAAQRRSAIDSLTISPRVPLTTTDSDPYTRTPFSVWLTREMVVPTVPGCCDARVVDISAMND